MSAPGNNVGSRTATMPRYLWSLDAEGWPLERIDTGTGQHAPVVTSRPCQ